jgi:hypothetical protein
MWILLLLITCWSILAFVTNHQRQSLLIITFLGTGGFQLMPIHWFWSPLLLVKPYDYAFVAMGVIFLLRTRSLGEMLAQERMARLALAYIGYLLLVLLASIAVFSYSPVQSVQSVRIFFWPAFLLLFLLVEQPELERFVRTLFPIVIVLSLLYLLQPVTGKTIINPSGEYYNPYVGSTDTKRYLSTPDFLIFFLLLAYHRLCKYDGKSLWVRLGQFLGLLLFSSVQMVSFTRSAIMGTGLALLYLSKRLVNPLLLGLFIASLATSIAIGYSTNSLVEKRIDDGLKDITAMLDGRFLNRDAEKDGTLNFRIAHVSERLSYVLDKIERWPMGIGFIHEDSSAAQNLGFRIGIKNIFTGRTIQVDSGDIAWSVVIIKTGVVGLLLLLTFLGASFFAVGNSRHAYVVVYRGALLYFIVTSFFSSNLVSPNYMLPLMLFLALALKSRVEASPAPLRAELPKTFQHRDLARQLPMKQQGHL